MVILQRKRNKEKQKRVIHINNESLLQKSFDKQVKDMNLVQLILIYGKSIFWNVYFIEKIYLPEKDKVEDIFGCGKLFSHVR